jgi:hypothetical protein
MRVLITSMLNDHHVSLKVHVNRFIDVIYDEDAKRARVYVDGKPFLYCAFVIAKLDIGHPLTNPNVNNFFLRRQIDVAMEIP